MSDWTNPANGNWSDPTKWTGGVPDAAGAVASFIVPNPGNATVLISFSQNADFTVGTLNITTDNNQGWTFQGEAGVTSATLRLAGSGGGPAFINVDTNGSSRTSSISDVNGLKLVLDSDLIVTTMDADTLLNISAAITGPGRDIYKFGSGTLRLNDVNPLFTGDVFVNAGRLELTNGGALGTSNLIKINNGATLAATINDFTLSSNIETGSGNAKAIIAAATGHTLTLSGQLELRSTFEDAVTFGSATDSGTIVLSGTSLIHGTGGFDIAGGTVRIGNAGVAANYFSGLTGGADVGIAAGAIFDTGGFVSTIHNFNLDGGTLQSTGDALDLTSDIVNFALINESGSIVGTAQADRLVLNVAGGVNLNLSVTNFTGWTSGTDTITLNALAGCSITGSNQNDTINGSAGNDQLAGFGGVDTIRGGAGDDQYSIIDTLSTLIENPGEGTDTVNVLNAGPTQVTLGANFENLAFTDSAQHTGNGNAANNILTGGGGIDSLLGAGGGDTLRGGGGADVLDGGAGADQMDGGTGDDLFFVDIAADAVAEAAGAGNDRVFAGISYTLTAGASIETFTTTDSAAIAALNLTGNALAQSIVGNAGANTLDSGGGGDTMVGLGGNDFYFVRSAADRAVEDAGGGTDQVFAAVSFTLEAGSAVETLRTISQTATTAINLTGNALTQTMLGNEGSNMLDSGGGGDAMVGVGGDDFYFVRSGSDRAVEAVGGGTDRVFAATSFTLETGSEVETISTVDSGAGTAINLTGNAFAQLLFANAGANVLDGKAGADTLTGLGGADTFSFTTALGGGNVDLVTDFQSGVDKISLENAVFTGLAGGALPAGAFVTGSAAVDADDRIIYNNATGALLFDADGNGAGAAVLFATLQGAPALNASDFVVI